MNFEYFEPTWVAKEPFEEIEKVKIWADSFAEFLSKVTKCGVVMCGISSGISNHSYYIEYDVVGITDFSIKINARNLFEEFFKKVNVIKEHIDRHVC